MLKKLRLYIYNHLGFSKSEANGLIFLVTFSVLFFIVPGVYINHFIPQTPVDGPSKEIKTWINSLEKKSEHKKNKLINYKTDVNKKQTIKKSSFDSGEHKIHKFQFDPNQLPLDSLKLLGLKPYIADRIVKYREAGGEFKEKNDLFTIYGIDSAIILNLWEYIQLSTKEDAFHVEKMPAPKIDLNKARKSDLLKIQGIGPTFSDRILKYGKILGGYASLNQLREVYNLPDSTISAMEESFFIGDDEIQKIDINSFPEDSLRKHPYISYKLAGIIVNYRDQHGSFQDVKELKKIKLIDNELFKKLSPYLYVEKQ